MVLLLDGNWHQVDWVHLVQLMEGWTDHVQEDDSAHLGKYATLVSVKELLLKTMKMFGLSKAGATTDTPVTCTGFKDKVLQLERRTRAIPNESAARRRAISNVIEVFKQGLKEFGQRWAKQCTRPTKYDECPIATFDDKNYFVMRRFDKLDKVADQLHDFVDVLPEISEGGTFWQNQAPLQRANKPVVEIKGSNLSGEHCLIT